MKRKLLITFGAVLALIGLSSCGTPGGSSAPDAGAASTGSSGVSLADLPAKPGEVTIGSADFPENEILAHVYADAMQSKGVKVSLHTGVGERPAYLAALKDGSIGAIPEYSGSILDYLDTSATATAPADVFKRLQSVAANNGFAVTQYAAAEDADTVTVTKATADKFKLKSISDLRSHAGTLRFAAPAPFQTVPYGLPGLRSEYGVVFGQFVPLSASGSITQTALEDGTVDAADIFSTDPAIAKEHFVSLSDPKHLFSAQNIVPLFRRDVLTRPMQEAADAVSSKLTTTDLQTMLAEASAGQSPSDIARRWIKDHNLS